MPQDGYGYDTIDNHNYLRADTFNFLFSDDNHASFFYILRLSNPKNKSEQEKNEHKLLSYTRKGIDQSLWDWGINHCQDFADHAHHDCGPGMNNNSKDSDTVSALYDVLDDANNINTLAVRFYNNYFGNNHNNNQKTRIQNKIDYYTKKKNILIKKKNKIINKKKKKKKIKKNKKKK